MVAGLFNCQRGAHLDREFGGAFYMAIEYSPRQATGNALSIAVKIVQRHPFEDLLHLKLMDVTINFLRLA